MDATHKITKNLGGDRLGSGNKNNISMHAYNRSTHDLSRAFRTSMTTGTLVPFMVEPALPGDTWTINLEALVRTIPAVAPLYGSYKLQLDVFECPIRLYNGLLHNNMTKIGLNMAQVKLPKILLSTTERNPYQFITTQKQIAPDSLLSYLGINGIGGIKWKENGNEHGIVTLERKFNAVPILAYYDIYKNYYANKQEEQGVIISTDTENTGNYFIKITTNESAMADKEFGLPEPATSPMLYDTKQRIENNFTPENNIHYFIETTEGIQLAEINLWDGTNSTPLLTVFPYARINDPNEPGAAYNKWGIDTGRADATYLTYIFTAVNYNEASVLDGQIKLKKFDLQNIDDARIAILQGTGLNNEVIINGMNVPYNDLVKLDTNNRTMNRYNQYGLAVKTHQSDLFNNWLQTEWIDGVNGINQITAIDVSSGSFTIDALNLANKVYNMLNRIAVSGGSYEDYIEAVYSTTALRRAETPVYKGGMSAEIVFEEVVSTAKTEDDPLGTLAGKGNSVGKKGGHIEIRCEEPSFIIGIVSITPRLDYSQGNKWFMTELDTLDDLHKPALDGVGFEDLLQERMAWWGTVWSPTDKNWTKLAAGKVPAWINYMTSVNDTHGDFAEEDKAMFMTLNRRYEHQNKPEKYGIKDLTTYVNPTKFNYTFADTNLSAQNFWVQIGIGCEVRRVMSAKIIPNL